jgi:hypothetical protein
VTQVSLLPSLQGCYQKRNSNTDLILGTLDVDLKANSGANAKVVYSASKFTQLLGAHYWRRNLPDCKVVAVSPGLIPNTKLAQHSGLRLTMDMPDAKTVPEGKQFWI